MNNRPKREPRLIEASDQHEGSKAPLTLFICSRGAPTDVYRTEDRWSLKRKRENPGPYFSEFATTAYGVGSHVGKFGLPNASDMLAILASDEIPATKASRQERMRN